MEGQHVLAFLEVDNHRACLQPPSVCVSQLSRNVKLSVVLGRWILRRMRTKATCASVAS